MAAPDRMIYQTEETRNIILEEAERLFVEQGFAETQMKDVAVAAGISRASLYRYYRDKVDLGFAVLGMFADRFSEEFRSHLEKDEGLSAREQLVKLAVRIANPKGFETDNRFVAEFDAYFSGSNIPRDFSRRLPSVHDELVSRLRQIARQGREDGSIRNDLTVSEVVNLVVFSLRNAQHMLLLRGDALTTFSAKERKNHVAKLARVISDGLKPQ